MNEITRKRARDWARIEKEGLVNYRLRVEGRAASDLRTVETWRRETSDSIHIAPDYSRSLRGGICLLTVCPPY